MSKTNNAKLMFFGSLVVHYSCVRIEKNKQYYIDYLTENCNVLKYLYICASVV
jgi:hypothetical protein